MKIEKVNDNQIRCILTREDLAQRQMKLSELAYGTEKAKSLFQEMMNFAYSQYGFEAEDLPLMIEAVPLSAETILLIVTKVAYPDELDSRFSNFSDTDDDIYYNSASDAHTSAPAGLNFQGSANDILEQCASDEAAPEQDAPADGMKMKKHVRPVLRQYLFHRIDDIISLAHILRPNYHGRDSLYKDDRGDFHLLVYMDGHSPAEFNRICNIITEYGLPVDPRIQTQYYLMEHGTLIDQDHALEDLAAL